jgi:hypothetical protein
LGIVGGLDNRIRGEEFAEDRVVESGAVVVKAELVTVLLEGYGPFEEEVPEAVAR